MSNFTQVVEQVEKRIAEKRARLVALLNDPDMAPYVEALRHGEHLRVTPARVFNPPQGFKNGNGIRDAIRKLLADESHPFFEMRDFDRTNVKNFLDEMYGEGAYSMKAIGDALHHLSSSSKDKVLKKVSGGEGGKLSIYQRV